MILFLKQLKVNQCKRQDIRNKTVEIETLTVIIAETKTPTQRYKFDSAWFTLYQWLEMDEEHSKIEDSECYYCEFCR